jgi:hypothetical protein
MFVENLCGPAVLYLGFSLTQIIIDLFRKAYNTAIIKSAVAIVFTTVLNMLCKQGLSVISWFVVFIPFVTMTLVTGILLYVFGLAPFTGKLQYSSPQMTQPVNPAIKRDPNLQPHKATTAETTSEGDAKTSASDSDSKEHPTTTKSTTHAGKRSNTSSPASSAAPTTATTSGQTIVISSRTGNPLRTIGSGVGSIVGGVGKGVGDILGGLGQGISTIGSVF